MTTKATIGLPVGKPDCCFCKQYFLFFFACIKYTQAKFLVCAEYYNRFTTVCLSVVSQSKRISCLFCYFLRKKSLYVRFKRPLFTSENLCNLYHYPFSVLPFECIMQQTSRTSQRKQILFKLFDNVILCFSYTNNKSVKSKEIKIELFYKTFTKTRKFKNNTLHTNEKPYSIYTCLKTKKHM